MSITTIPPTNTTEYSIANNQCQLQGTVTAAGSGPLSSCTITLNFDPAEIGTRQARLTIPTTVDVGGVPQIVVLLEGIGFRGPRLEVRDGVLKVNSEYLIAFTNQTVGGLYAARTLALSNGGSRGELEVILPPQAGVPGFSIKPSAGSGCTSLPPGGAAPCNVEIKFDPTLAQPYDAAVEIRSRPAGSSDPYTVFRVKLSGQGVTGGTPAISWRDPQNMSTVVDGINFDETTVGNEQERTIRLFNNGPGGGVRLVLINAVGADAPHFRVNVDAATCAIPGVLFQASFCDVVVRFAPGTAGAKTVTIQVTSETGNGPYLLVVRGAASGPSKDAALTPFPPVLPFADTRMGGQSEPQEVTLRSTGSRDLNVLAYELTGPFSIQNKTCPTVPFVLTPGSECKVALVFVPVSNGSTSGMLRITTNSIVTPTEITLSGNGQPAPDLDSGGCSIATGNSVVDPTLWLLVLAAVALLLHRMRSRSVKQTGARTGRHVS